MRNSDSPDLDPALLTKAFEEIEAGADVVFGPDTGGGYYLVALKSPCPALFNVPTSTKDNLKKTLERADTLDLVAKLLPLHPDIDTPDDLVGLRERIKDTTRARICPATLAALASF